MRGSCGGRCVAQEREAIGLGFAFTNGFSLTFDYRHEQGFKNTFILSL